MMLRAIVAVVLSLSLLPTSARARDNFIIFIADDLGVDSVAKYSDDTAYGHPGEGAQPVLTDNIDDLAEEGVLFRNAYTNPTCAPTRAQLLTGRHAYRTGIGNPGGAILDDTETSVADLVGGTHLSAAIGKWHVGTPGDAAHPLDMGFDYFAGALNGNINAYDDWTKTINDAGAVTVLPNHATYATDDVSAEAIAKINEFGDDEFLLWVAFNAPHSPFHVPTPPLVTVVDDMSTSRVKYVAAIEAMDREIKDILDALDPAVRADTTIIFIGDNGTPSGVTRNPFDSAHAKGTVYEGGINVPLIVVSPHIDVADQGTESLALVQSVDIFATIADIVGLASGAEDSVSVLPYLEDPTLPTRPIRPFAYADQFDPNGVGGPYTSHERAITDGQYKLIWRDDVFEEFFDLTTHPFEDLNRLPYDSMSDEYQDAYDILAQQMDSVELSGDVACPAQTDLACTTGYLKASIDWRVSGGEKDKLKVKLSNGPTLAQTDYGDPVIADGTGYSLCVYDDADALAAELRVVRGGQLCSGKECWKTVGGDVPTGKGYKYKDKPATATGVIKAQLRDGDAGKSKWKLDGRGENLPDGVTETLISTTSATIQFRGNDVTSCLSATVTDISTQDAERFKARE